MIYAEDCKWSDSILKGSQNLITTTYRTNFHTLSPFLFAVKNMNSWIWKKNQKKHSGYLPELTQNECHGGRDDLEQILW